MNGHGPTSVEGTSNEDRPTTFQVVQYALYITMATPLYPTLKKRVTDAIDQLITKQVTPWPFMKAGPPFRISRFDGRPIAYQGVAFEGSPRGAFWGRYIDPFLEDLCISEISAAVMMAKGKGVDGKSLLLEIQSLLSSGFTTVYERMADVDRRLRGKGYPQNVPLRPVEHEIQRMNRFLDERALAEIEMWQPKPWHQDWYENNKFWVWLIGAILSVGGILAKGMNVF